MCTHTQYHLGCIQPCSSIEINLCIHFLRKSAGSINDPISIEDTGASLSSTNIRQSTGDPLGSIWIMTIMVSNVKSLELQLECFSKALNRRWFSLICFRAFFFSSAGSMMTADLSVHIAWASKPAQSVAWGNW